MVMICEQILRQIMSYTDANLRVGMCQLEEEVTNCEAAAAVEPLPDAVTACNSDVISKKRASELFKTFAAAPATQGLYDAFEKLKLLKDKLSAMQAHPLVQGRCEDQSEILTTISGRMEASQSKADRVETLIQGRHGL